MSETEFFCFTGKMRSGLSIGVMELLTRVSSRSMKRVFLLRFSFDLGGSFLGLGRSSRLWTEVCGVSFVS